MKLPKMKVSKNSGSKLQDVLVDRAMNFPGDKAWPKYPKVETNFPTKKWK